MTLFQKAKSRPQKRKFKQNHIKVGQSGGKIQKSLVWWEDETNISKKPKK